MPHREELREQVHLWSGVCTFALLIAIITVLALLQGVGVVSFNSDRAVLNGVELLVTLLMLAIIFSMGLYKFFLIGLRHMMI